MDGVCPRCGEMCFDCWQKKAALQWFNIQHRQPEPESTIVMTDITKEGHVTIAKAKWYQTQSVEDWMDYCKKNNLPLPQFYWMYAKDFPFPEWKEF